MTGTGTLARKTGDGGVRWLSEGNSAGRSIGRMPARPDPAISGIHLLPAAGSRPAIATDPGAAGLERISQRALDHWGSHPLARLLARYPGLATALVLPPLLLSIPSAVAGDAVGLILGAFSLLAGLVFAASAAREMARDGLTPSTTPHPEDAP